MFEGYIQLTKEYLPVGFSGSDPEIYKKKSVNCWSYNLIRFHTFFFKLSKKQKCRRKIIRSTH